MFTDLNGYFTEGSTLISDAGIRKCGFLRGNNRFGGLQTQPARPKGRKRHGLVTAMSAGLREADIAVFAGAILTQPLSVCRGDPDL